jgi:hypothetical protein
MKRLQIDQIFLIKLRSLIIESKECIIESKEWEKEWDALYRYTLQEEPLSFIPILVSKALRILEKDGHKLEDIIMKLKFYPDESTDVIKHYLASILSRLDVDLIRKNHYFPFADEWTDLFEQIQDKRNKTVAEFLSRENG